jgi:uncharacterized membrane protein
MMMGGTGLGLFVLLLLLIGGPLLLLLVVGGGVLLSNHTHRSVSVEADQGGRTPYEILDERLARGEITREDYNRIRNELQRPV